MPNALDMSVLALAAARKAVAGTSVRIRRKAKVSEPITATLGRTTFEVIKEDEEPTRQQSADWLFTASDIVLAGKVVELQPFDVIEVIDGGRRFEVQPIPGRKCVEPQDPAGLLVRVHTKEIKPCPTS